MSNASELLNALSWRQAGPFRGGRSVAVATDPQYTGQITWRGVQDGLAILRQCSMQRLVSHRPLAPVAVVVMDARS